MQGIAARQPFAVARPASCELPCAAFSAQVPVFAQPAFPRLPSPRHLAAVVVADAAGHLRILAGCAVLVPLNHDAKLHSVPVLVRHGRQLLISLPVGDIRGRRQRAPDGRVRQQRIHRNPRAVLLALDPPIVAHRLNHLTIVGRRGRLVRAVPNCCGQPVQLPVQELTVNLLERSTGSASAGLQGVVYFVDFFDQKYKYDSVH